eukprot:TRINITY_DN1404_c0_g1_i1.p1 TRINITY_DN1404_c0_g1~~TRINITY_DN1404_c0_g1_i1.p1  ORF type:complete len:163 (-),score=25.24 TRINITY_DN1404_c0_g1_i1:296-751(-)
MAEQALQAALAASDFQKIANICQESELNGRPFYDAHLASLLILNDLCNAKFLWKRIPKDLRTPEIAAIWEIGRNIWTRNYPSVYTSLNQNWSPQISPLIAKVALSFRTRTLTLLSSSYSSISVGDCSVFLGLAPENTIPCKMLFFFTSFKL